MLTFWHKLHTYTGQRRPMHTIILTAHGSREYLLAHRYVLLLRRVHRLVAFGVRDADRCCRNHGHRQLINPVDFRTIILDNVTRLSLGRRLVNFSQVAQRTNALTNGVVDRPWVVGREFESHVHHENAFEREANLLMSRI